MTPSSPPGGRRMGVGRFSRLRNLAVTALVGTLITVGCSEATESSGSKSVSSAVAIDDEFDTIGDGTRPLAGALQAEVPAKSAPLLIPLTGVPVEDHSEIPRRPALAVKIPMNDPQSMPHAGLNRADIVFQTIINDQFTRLIAVFQSQTSEVLGPIRSGRAQDVDIVSAFRRPLFAYSGGNEGVRRVMRDAQDAGRLVDLGQSKYGGLYYRRSGRPPAPHNLFSSTEALWSQTPPKSRIPRPVFPYLEPEAELNGPSAEAIDVALDSIRSHWDYDPNTGRYLKLNNGRPHMTENDGQVWADNVVVMVVDYGKSPVDGRVPRLSSTGSNPVFVFSRNTVRQGVWYRADLGGGWAFLNNVVDQEPIGLVPGRTWVELPRNQPGVFSYESGGRTVAPIGESG